LNELADAVLGEVEEVRNPTMTLALTALTSSKPIEDAMKVLDVDVNKLAQVLAPVASTIPGTSNMIVSRAIAQTINKAVNEL
jgi:hypothetical protein